ncbi:chorismate synthase [Lactobacillus delbrueckii]|uniref:chorismate synthase n=1 Tax=Lactobacillus delbrueckii TaxID=1584 RepID=UPI001E2EFD5D|nr:chorismate synthase [Lactobacillus delbrueckii subsp. lactis]MCD5484159.1 chorismate synthase [Lactobacillus delbrueckii subsp. lactis]
MALGNIAQQFLRQLDIDLVAYVAQVGPVEADSEKPLDVSEIRQKIFQNDMHVIDQDKVEDLHQLISETKEKGDTLGGIIPLVATGLPAGLGSYVSWDTKLDAKLAAAAVGGNSGTTNRLLLGILAGSSFASQLIGDASLSKRPMKRVSQPLAKFGAEIALSPAGTLPATVIGQKLHGAEIQLEVASAQVKSAAIFAALEAGSPSTIIEKLPTRNHTEIMLRQFGADITTEADNLTIHVQPGQELLGQEVEVPGDMSSAAFWLTAGRLRESWLLMS